MKSQITLTTDLNLPKKCQICSKRGDCEKRKVKDVERGNKLVEECVFYLMR